MSRLWRDRLLASLAPGAVALARVSGGPRPRLTDRRTLECDPAFGPEPWQGAVAALAAALEPLRSSRMNVTVVLSNHFVRYAVVPHDPAITQPEEDLALARFHFSKVHGERAAGWAVRMSEEARGAPRLAGAVDAALIDALRACFPAGGKLLLESAQPYLMSAFNLWRRSVPAASWLLLVEPGRACCALLGARRWVAVHTARGEFATADDQVALLEREALRTDAVPAGNTVLVHAPAGPRAPGADTQGWKFQDLTLPALEGYRPVEDAPLAMALTAR